MVISEVTRESTIVNQLGFAELRILHSALRAVRYTNHLSPRVRMGVAIVEIGEGLVESKRMLWLFDDVKSDAGEKGFILGAIKTNLRRTLKELEGYQVEEMPDPFHRRSATATLKIPDWGKANTYFSVTAPSGENLVLVVPSTGYMSREEFLAKQRRLKRRVAWEE